MFTRRAFATGVPKRPVKAPLYSARYLHASAPVFVKVGDAVPNIELVEDSPGNKVSIANELKGRQIDRQKVNLNHAVAMWCLID
jgi:2-Cys peroxiredoxin 5